MSRINETQISASIPLQGGERVVVVNRLDNPAAYTAEEMHFNLYRVDRDGRIVWQIGDYNPMENSTFTNVYEKEGGIYAYNYDGIEYVVETSAGVATPKTLLR